MEILFLLDYYSPHRWWIENVFEHLINWLLEKWHKITLITSRFQTQLKPYEKDWNLTIYRIWRTRKWFFLKWFFKACKILRKNKNIKVIHSSSYTSAVPASVLAKLFHKKSVVTIHEIFGKLWKELKPLYSRWIFQLFEWLMIKFPHDIYHCVSLYTLNSLRIKWWISDKKLHLIYNWVDNDFRDIKKVKKSEINEWKKKYWWNNSYLISYYGHAWKTKWIDLLVKAIPQILRENPDCKLLFNIIQSKRTDYIVEQINSISKQLKAGNKIQIFRWFSKEDLRIFVACADIIIAPSLAEWFGSVHSEACAMWKNLITSNLAAIPEVVSGNVILMSPPSAKWICEAIQKIRKWNLKKIPEKRFSWDYMVDEVETLFKHTL